MPGIPKQARKERISKKRNWAFIVYPDSAPENWREVLAQTGLQCAVSPLHDKDKNADEYEKKPHYHVIAVYSGPTSFSVVKKITESLNAPIPIPLEQIRGYYRYFTHKDNPDKFQYDEMEITTINGFSIADFVELTRSEIHRYKIEIQQYIREFDIFEYSDLMDSLLDAGMLVEHEVASNHTFYFNAYIRSRRHRVEKPIGN